MKRLAVLRLLRRIRMFDIVLPSPSLSPTAFPIAIRQTSSHWNERFCRNIASIVIGGSGQNVIATLSGTPRFFTDPITLSELHTSDSIMCFRARSACDRQMLLILESPMPITDAP